MPVLIYLGIGIFVAFIAAALIWRHAYIRFYSEKNLKSKKIASLEDSIDWTLRHYGTWIVLSVIMWWATIPIFIIWMIGKLLYKIYKSFKPWSIKLMQNHYEKRNGEKLI